MKIRKGTIVVLNGDMRSGIAELVVDEMIAGEEKRVAIPCDYAMTARALHGGTFKEVFFTVDKYGVLDWFVPQEDAPPEIARMHEEKIP